MNSVATKAKKSAGRPRGWTWNPPPSLSIKYYTVGQAAEALGCSTRQVRKLIAANLLTTTRYNEKYLLVLKASIAMYIAEKSGESMPTPTTTRSTRRSK